MVHRPLQCDEEQSCGRTPLAFRGKWSALENDIYVRPPNVLTLSCKSRPLCRPPRAARRLPRLARSSGSRTAADVTPACSSEPPSGGSAAEPRLGGFCQLVRGVSRRATGSGAKLKGPYKTAGIEPGKVS